MTTARVHFALYALALFAAGLALSCGSLRDGQEKPGGAAASAGEGRIAKLEGDVGRLQAENRQLQEAARKNGTLAERLPIYSVVAISIISVLFLGTNLLRHNPPAAKDG